MIQVTGDEISVETSTVTATLKRGWLTALADRATGESLIEPFDPCEESALQLVYGGGEAVRLDGQLCGEVHARRLNDHRAEFRFHSWDGDGTIEVGEEPATGDLVVQPAAFSSRPGVLACRWVVRGIRRDLRLVAPLWQGVDLEIDDPINRDARRRWPHEWEAGLVILQGSAGGFWMHCRDDRFRYKALRFGASSDSRALSLESEAYGPIEANLAAGGLPWRLNVHQGGWDVPARAYRDWLWSAYGLSAEAARRPPWLEDLTMAICWCPSDTAVLDAVARKVDPKRVLIHLPHWRTDRYDQNYPAYTAGSQAKAFVAAAAAMGYHVAPHFNALEVDPSHSVYSLVGDFAYRDVESGRFHGWAYADGRIFGVPSSGRSLASNRSRNVMVKVHPGLSMWRAVLCEAIQAAAQDLSLEAVFTDVTLCTGNLRNCLVEGMTSTEGVRRLIEMVSGLGDGLAVGGEGLNEITAQGLSFAQAHLYGYGGIAEGVERTGGCALNHVLFGDLCRTIGYTRLGGRTEEEVLRMRLHEEHGAMPTITVRSADEIEDPNPAVRSVLDRAAG
jgi:hypothetical protein